MTICDRFDIVVVPFPFVEMDVVKPRPSVVLSRKSFNRLSDQTILAMVTTAARSDWPSDIPIADLAATGLQAASVIRFKIFTLPNRLIARLIGRLAKNDASVVAAAIRRILG
jgi:mRNA interferase MazF